MTRLAPTPARITGRDLYRALSVSLDDGAELGADWGAAIDGVPVDGARRADDRTVDLIVPAGLAVGAHDVALIGPDGARYTLPGALVVTDEPVGLVLAIEDVPGGAGPATAAAALRAGDPLTAYAVMRTPAGAFVADVAATWTAAGGRGVLVPVPPSGVTFEARLAGTDQLAATYSVTTPAAPVALTVVAADPAALVVETAPGGAGIAVPAQGLTTDATLPVHAVVRDAFGNFVADVPAAWSVTGAIGVVADLGIAGGVLDPRTPGVGQVIADAAGFTAATGDLAIAPGKAAALAVARTTLAITADAAPVAFATTATDADGNATLDLGTVTWATTGPITQIDPGTGVLDPRAAGTGTVTVASSHGPTASSGAIAIAPGRAAAIGVAPATVVVSADDPPVAMVATATDADANPTTDLGTVTWSNTGPITLLDPATGALDPRAAGTGTVTATSSYGPAGTTGSITIVPGRAAMLAVSPPTATMSADAAPLAFDAGAQDADGNPTTDTGGVTWATTGPITLIDPATGVLDPRAAGIGTVVATSGYGPSAASGSITINPGRAVALSVSPAGGALILGDVVAFTPAGTDADGNSTADLGSLGWSVTGGFAEIDATGRLVATAPAAGTVGLASSYGPTTSAGPFTVAALAITAVTAPAAVSRGQRNARFTIDVTNPTTAAFPVIAGWIDATQGGVASTADYTIEGDWRNPDVIAPGASATLVLWVTIGANARLGAIELSGAVQTGRNTAVVTRRSATAWTVDAGPAPTAVIAAAPTAICRGGSTTLDGAGSTGAAPLGYAWSLDLASPATSTAAMAAATYPVIGPSAYSLSVVDAAARTDTARYGFPLHVGETAAQSALGESYPTGRIVPTRLGPNNVNVSLGSLPSNNVIDDATGFRILQCDANNISTATYRYVTLWTDRGTLTWLQDQKLAVPGFQRLTAGDGKIDEPTLLAGPMPIEGPGMVYAEFRHPNGTITASGHAPITFTGDTVAPTITAAAPVAAPGCGAAVCSGKDHVLRFRASEPLNPATVSLATVVVDRGPAGSTCADATAFSPLAAAVAYDVDARTITVHPGTAADAQYKLRVRLGTGIRDTAAAANALAAYTVCVTVADLAAPPAAAPTGVGASPTTLSPDDDGVADTTTFTATVPAGVLALEVDVSRGPRNLVTLTRAVNLAAGTYAIAWDGRDATGRMVRDGPVLYTVRAIDALGKASPPVHGVVIVDSAISFVNVPRPVSTGAATVGYCGDFQCDAGEAATCPVDCAACGSSCATCDNGCCAQSCGPGDCALSCTAAGCPCRFDCDATPGTCTVDCVTSDCYVDCRGVNNCDAVTCTGGASCIVACAGANNCSFAACEGAAATCLGGDYIVCNESCP